MAAILNSAILNLDHLGFSHLSFSFQTHSYLPRLVPTICTKKNTLTLPLLTLHKKTPFNHWHTWWWQPSWILPSRILPSWIQLLHCGIQTPCFLLSDSLQNTLPPLWLWLKLIQSDSNSFILNQHDDGSHLEFCHLEFSHVGFSHLSFTSQTHSYLPRLVPTICTKKTSLTLPSPPFAQKNFTHSFWLNLMMVAILNSAILDLASVLWNSDTLFSSLRFTQKTLTPLWLWLKLIQSDSN